MQEKIRTSPLIFPAPRCPHSRETTGRNGSYHEPKGARTLMKTQTQLFGLLFVACIFLLVQPLQ
ncbi:MAG: hypothetical protein NTW33_04750, partial [Methanoregula sp.]|nr:hypothetical protein [Methanoregula sp.]